MRVMRWLFFVVYLGLLIKIVLFKSNFFFTVVPTHDYYRQNVVNGTYASYNLVPFQTIRLYLSGAVSFTSAFFNLAGNVLLFAPLGFLLPFVLQRMNRFWLVFITTLILSAAFEIYQYTTRTGQCDIDDVILNTAGGLIGYFLFRLLTTHRPVGNGTSNAVAP